MSRRKKSKIALIRKYIFRSLIVGVPLVFLGTLIFLLVQNFDTIKSNVKNNIEYFSLKTGLTVQKIVVEGRLMTDEKSLIETLNISPNTPILLLNLQELSDAIHEQVPWVVKTRIERHFPNTLHITLQEIKPIARWQAGNRFFIIGEEKTVAVPNFIGFETLPLLTGRGADDESSSFLRLVQAEPEIFNRMKGAERISNRRWDILLKGNIRIMLPDKDTGLALSRLSKMHREKKVLDKNISHIDMRIYDRVFIQKVAPAPSSKPSR